MLKPIKWSSIAENDFANIVDYLETRWNNIVCIEFIDNIDFCIGLIQKKPNLFPFFSVKLKIRKCVVTK